MTLCPNLIAFVQSCEGFRSTVYLCAAGYKTIGYGHVLAPGEAFGVLTPAEAEQLLIQDLERMRQHMLRLIEVPLMPYQANALLSFTFNVGTGALQRSTLRQKINREEHPSAAQEFSRWVWANGRKLPGLVLRRQLEADMYQGFY